MGDIARYVPLKTVVAYAMDECGKSAGDYDQFWLLAFRALIDIYFSIEAEPKTVRIPVAANKTAPFPADFISWTKIGVMGSDGKVVSLRINKTISKYRDNNPDRITDGQADVNTGIGGPMFFNFFNNGSYQVLFGAASGLIVPGECVVDEKNKMIVLGYDLPYADVVMEYISAPEKDNDYQVDLFVQEAVIAFIKWKAKLGNDTDYYNRKREARRKINPISSQIIEDVIRSGRKYCLKG